MRSMSLPSRPEPVSPRIDDPMALLLACHEKVRHFTDLAVRLHQHVQVKGPDGQAQEAARAVLRYFNVAAPLHHADEEVDLFPALLALGDADLTHTAKRLHAEHAALDAMWAALDSVLQQVAAGRPWPDSASGGSSSDAAGAVADPQAFADRYQAHAHDEETLLYPHAQRLSAPRLQQLADAMVARRRQP